MRPTASLADLPEQVVRCLGTAGGIVVSALRLGRSDAEGELARDAVEHLEVGDILFAAGAEVLELACLGEHARFERADGAVVALDRTVEALAQADEVLGE